MQSQSLELLYKAESYNDEFILDQALSICEDCDYDEQMILEVLSKGKAQGFVAGTRAGLNTRRVVRGTLVGLIPLGNVLNILSEGGIIPTTEKFAFSRFQGLSAIHAQRLDKRLNTTQVTGNLKKIRDSFSKALAGVNKKDVKTISKFYTALLSSEMGLIGSGYIKLMTKSGVKSSELSKVKSDFTNLKSSFVKGSGVFNRIKSGLGSAFFFSSIRPVFTIIKQYQRLAEKNPSLGLIAAAQKKIK